MKIIFICNEYPPRPHGGIGTFVQTIARALTERGHEVSVVGLGPTGEEYVDDDIRVVTLAENKTRFVGNLISRFRLRGWLGNQVRSGKVDVIEVPDYLGLLPFAVRGCTTVVRLHLSATAIYRQAGLKAPTGISFYERRTLLSNSNWIGVSQHIIDATKDTFSISPQRSATIYNPVPSAPRNLPEMPTLPANFVLYAGQVSKRKGALVLAEAARIFLSNRDDLHLVYAGGEFKQPGFGSVVDQVKEIVGPALARRVQFLGHVNRETVLACMKRAMVFAFPSRLEALGLVVLEAMSCGLPVVCTSTGPGLEIIEDGENGLLADPNSPASWGDKIKLLLDDRPFALKLAANAQRVMEDRFSLKKCVEETVRFYEECI